jgi:hypothetical protein
VRSLQVSDCFYELEAKLLHRMKMEMLHTDGETTFHAYFSKPACVLLARVIKPETGRAEIVFV